MTKLDVREAPAIGEPHLGCTTSPVARFRQIARQFAGGFCPAFYSSAGDRPAARSEQSSAVAGVIRLRRIDV